jgi:hypothetical protein
MDFVKSRGKSPGGLVAHAPVNGLATGPGYGERSAQARGDLLEIELDRKELRRLVEAGVLMLAADFERNSHRSAALVVQSVESDLTDWVTTICGAATEQEALAAIEGRLANIKKWVSEHA